MMGMTLKDESETDCSKHLKLTNIIYKTCVCEAAFSFILLKYLQKQDFYKGSSNICNTVKEMRHIILSTANC